MQTVKRLQSVRIKSGVFSRTYDLGNGSASIIYNTPAQTVTFLEDDSAQVWRRLHDSQGKPDEALKYIRENGQFESDPDVEAEAVLVDFLHELDQSGLFVTYDVTPSRASNQDSATDREDALSDLTISKYLSGQNILHSMVLELTYRCNERCVHCYLPENGFRSELTLERIDALFDEFTRLGGFVIQLTGGEPFLHRDFIQILGLVKKYKLVASISSNLTLMTDKILEAIAGIYPRWVGVSIYGHNESLHDSITKLPGSFQKSIRAVKQLKTAGVPVVMKSPLMRANGPHWREIESLASELECECQFDLNITAKNDGNHSPLAYRVDDDELIHDIFSLRYSKMFIHGEQMSSMANASADMGICGAGPSGLTIAPDGTIRPCIGLPTPIGKWPEQTLESAWKNSPFLKFFSAIKMRDIKPCNKCRDFAYCSRCPGAWQVETGDFKKPTNYTCRLGHAAARAMRPT